MGKSLLCASAAILAIAGASSVSAATIVYTVSGTGSGNLNGSVFNGDFTITSTGDTATQQPCMDNGMPIPECAFVVNDSLELDISGLGTFNVTSPSISFVNNASNLFGFTELIGPLPGIVNTFAFVNITDTPGPFSTWDGISDLPSYSTDLLLNNLFAPFVQTDGGQLMFDAGPPTAAIFSASILAPSVPEPSTWAMMIIGFGLVGAGLRRRKPKVTVSYA
ncbi:PEPxxWA-CTERM sorting domain-containing protein [Parasphingorhabdus sp.]|uniref:PEPxxWA-CTERM sorting domain-containing protein n=1 Tax=Parasphingorhabdus sp. TaxID=2709688 RepID=UPI003263BA31